MKRLTALALVATLILVMLASAPTTHAASYSLIFGDISGACSADSVTATLSITANLPTDVDVVGTLEIDGVVTLREVGGFPAGQYTMHGSAAWTAPSPSDSHTWTVRYDLSVGGESVGASIMTIWCTGGVFSATSSFSDGNFSGPTVPQGFVQRTITCDVAVFDAPGGSPVGSNRILAGQTFFASSESTEGPDGEPWSQVFVSSFVSPWIPTRCIGQ